MLKYLSNLCFHYVCCYSIGQSKFQGQLKFQGGGRFYLFVGRAFKLYHSGMNIRVKRFCGHFCTLPQIFWRPQIPMDIFSIFEKYLESKHFSLPPPLLLFQTTIFFASNRFPVFPPLLPVQYAPARANWKMVPPLFKTFHWLLTSFRIKFKFPLEATRLYMIRPFLWLQITLLLTHPIQLHLAPCSFSNTLNMLLRQGFVFAVSCQIFSIGSLLHFF